MRLQKCCVYAQSQFDTFEENKHRLAMELFSRTTRRLIWIQVVSCCVYEKSNLTLRLLVELFSTRTWRLVWVQVVNCCVYDKANSVLFKRTNIDWPWSFLVEERFVTVQVVTYLCTTKPIWHFLREQTDTNRLVMELFSRRTGRLESVQVVGCCVYDKPI